MASTLLTRESLSQTGWLLSSLLVVALLGFADSGTGPDVSLAPGYTILIMIASWRGGRAIGVIVGVACAFTWLLVQSGVQLQPGEAATSLWNAGIRAMAHTATALLVVALRNAIDAEWHCSRTDALTGAGNTRSFYDIGSVELRRAARHHYPLSLAYIDIDDFKLINDRFGHRAGDLILQSVAALIASETRSSDALARVGGDEFVVLLPHASEEAARKLVSRLGLKFATLMDRHGWPVTCSMALVTFEELPDSVDEMLGAAHSLICTAKREGKQRVAAACYRAVQTAMNPIPPAAGELSGAPQRSAEL